MNKSNSTSAMAMPLHCEGTMRNCDWWANTLKVLRTFDDKEIDRHARVSTSNNHRCVDCYCCACQTVREERSHAVAEKRRAIALGISETNNV
jgi:hypothetical protein